MTSESEWYIAEPIHQSASSSRDVVATLQTKRICAKTSDASSKSSIPAISRGVVKNKKPPKVDLNKIANAYNIKKSRKGIKKISDVLNVGESFDIISFQQIDTTYGQKNTMIITKNDEKYRVWCTADTDEIANNEPFVNLRNDPTFNSFKMKFVGKINQKYSFEMIQICMSET